MRAAAGRYHRTSRAHEFHEYPVAMSAVGIINELRWAYAFRQLFRREERHTPILRRTRSITEVY